MFSHLRQRGAIALVLLMVVGLGIAGAILAGFSRHALELYREQQTQNALNQAKQMILADALSKQGNLNVRPGEFFCPDRDAPNTAGYGQSGQGLGIPACIAAATRIGRIPWQSYVSEELRDSSGEPLWMAVVDNFQERRTMPLNSDTAPIIWFQAAANNGNQSLSSAADPVVVVILAPGAALSGQNRSTAAQRINPNNYFECNRATITGACIGAPNNYANYNLSQGRFLDGPRLDASNNPTLNDRFVVIRQSELFIPLERRAAKEYQQLLELWATQVGSKRLLPSPANPLDVGLPFPAKNDDAGCTQAGVATLLPSGCAPDPTICRGRPPRSVELTGVGLPVSVTYLVNPLNQPASVPSLAAWQSMLTKYDWLYRNRWEQLFFYAVANTPSCALPSVQLRNLQLPANLGRIDSVMIGAGVAMGAQLRASVADRALLNNYLESVTSYAAAPDINRRAWDAVPPQINQYAKLQLVDTGNDRLYYRHIPIAPSAPTPVWGYAAKERP
jgi:type II secretory pathway pseudopilin PulG